MKLEQLGVPSVLVATTEFERLARTIATKSGYPHLPMVVIPHPFTTLPLPDVLKIADAARDEILAALEDAAASQRAG